MRHRELNPDTVTHLSTNRARRWLTSLIEANALTTTPDHQLCEPRFLLLEYPVVLLIEYSSIRLISEVVFIYGVVQNKRSLGSSLKFVVEQLCEMSHGNAKYAKEIASNQVCVLQTSQIK